jgi:hypothetical protein
MRCLICHRDLTRDTFELFDHDKIRETYGRYKCDFDHMIEILEETKTCEKPNKSYKRYATSDKTDKMCPICDANMNHISDDSVNYPDWVFHYKRYKCSGIDRHIIRIVYDKFHNNEKIWRDFDKKAFGYDTEDDHPDR